MSSALLLALALGASEPPPSDVELLIAPQLGMEAGARSLLGVRQVIFLYDGALSRALAFDETGWQRRALAVVGRLLKLTFLDATIDRFLATVNHEVFGHGARARELGQWPSYSFGVPFPWGAVVDPSQTHAGYTTWQATGIADQELLISAGGLEAEAVSSDRVALRGLRDGALSYPLALHYLTSRVSYLPRWIDPSVIGTHTDGDDPDEYARQLKNRFNLWGPSSALAVSQRLRLAWATQFLDPLWWLCATQVVVGYVGRGERVAAIPQLRAGGLAFFPMVRLELSPFGAEHTLDVTAQGQTFLASVYVRAVSSGLATAVGGGARVFEWEVHPAVRLSGSLDVWSQPELILDWRNAFDGVQRLGVSGVVEAKWRPVPRLGVIGQLGAKTAGYVAGQPPREGVFGLVGVSLLLEGESPAVPGPGSRVR